MNTEYNVKHRCAACGHAYGYHGNVRNPYGGATGRLFACPAMGQEPPYPRSVKDEAKAREIFNERIAAFWRLTNTTFKPA